MENRAPNTIKLGNDISLRSKEGCWKPDRHARNTIESCGFIIGETIGEGVASKVKKAMCTRMNTTVAIKIVRKCQITKKKANKFVAREIAILQQLHHPSLLDVYDVYESSNSFYIVMEYIPNGDLLSLINKLGSIGEVDTRRIFRQLLNVVAFLHDNGVCHRDIKCDNILLDRCYNLKLIDFGFSRWIPSDHMSRTKCGSFVYTAPEVTESDQYDVIKADIWSMGICLYAALCGRLPFRDDDIDVLRYSSKEKLKFYKYVSKDCRKLLKEMLALEPSQRPSIGEIYRSAWMSKPLKSAGESSLSSMSVAAVLDSHHMPPRFDPYTEHGFNCDQNTLERKSSRVTDILQLVAENHSTGMSSVDLTKIVLPSKQASSAAMLTGVAGPVGRKISQQLGLHTGSSINTRCPSTFGGFTGIRNTSPEKLGFKKTFKAMKSFKAAARVVTAVRRMRRKPLKTILTIPQGEAMEKIMNVKENQTRHELKDLHFCAGGKVAHLCGEHQREIASAKHKSIEIEEEARREHQERIEFLGATVAKLIPVDRTTQ